MAQIIVGIDLGSYSVKVSVLERSFRDYKLIGFFEQPVAQGTRLTHEEASAAALKALLEKNPLPLDSVAITIPAHHLSCRVLEMPFTNVKKIEQTVEFELENFIPVPLEDLLVDYHILGMEENRSIILTTYIPRARFVKYLEVIQAAGVDPKYISVDAIDLSHIAQIALLPQKDPYVIIDIGHEKTNICVMEGPQLKYVRSVSLGGAHFTRAVQKAFKLSFDKAEALKQERGRVSLTEEGLDQVSRNLKMVADELLAFIQQTYMGYKNLYGEKAWTGIYLCGGGSKLNGLPEMMSLSMRLNVGTVDCLDFVEHNLSEPERCKDTIQTSLAETLKIIFSNKAVKINFRRGEFAYQRDVKALSGDIKSVASWLLVIFLLGLGNFLVSYYLLNTKLTRMDSVVMKEVAKQFPDTKGSNSKKMLSSINTKISELQSELEALDPAKQIKVMPLLLEVSKKMPPKEEATIDIDNLNFTGDLLRMDGRTTSFEAVDKIKNALSNSPYFKSVTTQNVAKGVRDEIKFSLSMDVATPGEEEEVEEKPAEKGSDKAKENKGKGEKS